MAYEITLLTTMAISVLFALSLNFLTGFCGQISLGHAAFMGVGAYTSALLMKAGVPFLATLPVSAFTAGFFGLFVGFASLRVRNDFLAITTMGVVFLFVGIVRQQDILGGENGISSIPSSPLGREGFMYLCLMFAVIFGGFSIIVKKSWMGFVFDSIADNEDVSRILGIDVNRYKLIAFVIGTAVAGVAGGLYAQHYRFVSVESFGFVESISVLAMVILGGVGSVTGVAISAALLSILPMLIQFVDDYKVLVYSSLLFIVVRFSPDGLAGIFRSLYNKLTSKNNAANSRSE